MLWLVRLSPVLGATPAELLDRLTAEDLALYQAAVEIDGPWWGAREAAYFRQLTSVTAAAAGCDLPADQLDIEWTVGRPAEAAGVLFTPAEGIALFASRHGLAVEHEDPTP